MIKIIQGDITTLAVDAIVNAANDSIAFPCISTGIYGYPIEDAAKIAVREVREFLTQRRKDAEEMEVVFCCFSERDVVIYEELIGISEQAHQRPYVRAWIFSKKGECCEH